MLIEINDDEARYLIDLINSDRMALLDVMNDEAFNEEEVRYAVDQTKTNFDIKRKLEKVSEPKEVYGRVEPNVRDIPVEEEG